MYFFIEKAFCTQINYSCTKIVIYCTSTPKDVDVILNFNVFSTSFKPKPRKSATEFFCSDSYNFQITRKLCKLLRASVFGGLPVLIQLEKCNNSLSVCFIDLEPL